MTDIVSYRNEGRQAAVVFLHGFTGEASKSWAAFPELIRADEKLSDWDIYELNYPSGKGPDIPAFWSSDPGIEDLAGWFRDRLSHDPLAGYNALVIVAHSMGGLVAQRALFDDDALSKRVAFLFLFGTPSRGTFKAWLFGFYKQQIRNMAAFCGFMRRLAKDRKNWLAQGNAAKIRAVAGLNDSFIMTWSSLRPFPYDTWCRIPGNHVEITKPAATQDLGYQLVRRALMMDGRAPRVMSGAQVAVELCRFQALVQKSLARSKELDGQRLVDLALALDALGRRDEATRILEESRGKGFSDAIGTLGGRYKRHWMENGFEDDWKRAEERYLEALGIAETAHPINHNQAFYHAINLAFLYAMRTPPRSVVPEEARVLAQRALGHCANAGPDDWLEATKAEANLYLGNLDSAERLYADALRANPEARQVKSMYDQAKIVAGHLYGNEGAGRIEKLFNP